jgi:hypothetical protein
VPTKDDSRPSPQDEVLEDLRSRMLEWRKRTRRSLSTMPSLLWGEAIAAAQLLGIDCTATALGLKVEELKRRAEGLYPTDSMRSAPEPSTLPDPATLLNAMPTLGTCLTVVVEAVAADGARLRVRIPMVDRSIIELIQRLSDARTVL